MIEVKDLTFSYDKKPFIEKMNFSAKSGEIFGFLGPSGAGKTTVRPGEWNGVQEPDAGIL